MRKTSLAPLSLVSWLIVGPVACGSSGGSAVSPPAGDDASVMLVPDSGTDAPVVVDSAVRDAAPDVALDIALPLDAAVGVSVDASVDASSDKFIAMAAGQPASLWWDQATSTLFIADNQNNQVWTWTDASGLAKYATTAATDGEIDAGATLVGQLVRQSDGTVVVARFGSPRGSYAAISYVSPDGGAGLVPGVDPARHHLGLGLAPGDKLFGSYFAGTPGGAMAGSVTIVDLQTGETDYATGFSKIVGVLVANGKIYVSDQGNSSIYVLPLDGQLPPDGGGYTVFATLPVPDQICAGPNGTIFSGQFQAAPNSTAPISVRQIKQDGTVTLFRSDPDVGKPSGCAYDPAQRRLFVADGSTLLNGVHIFPVP